MSSQAVVFIPGAKGSKLVDTNKVSYDTIWSGLQSEFETIEDLELTSADATTQFDVRPETIIAAGELERLAYGEFLRDIRGNKPIFLFNYDWRLSAVQIAEHLDGFLTYLSEKSAASREMQTIENVDLVTHSMGAQVVRAYMNLWTDPLHRINRAVFVAPPFAGTLDVVVTALCGEGFFGNTRGAIRKLVRGMPGAMEMVPVYEGAARFDSGARVDFLKVDHWQSNVATKKADLGSGETDYAQALRDTLKVARKTVSDGLLDLSTLSASARRRLLVVARDGYETLQSLRVVRDPDDQPVTNFAEIEQAVRSSNGDGRVAHVSSCSYAESIRTLLIRRSILDRDYSHGFVLRDERVQRIVRRFLYDNGLDFESPGRKVRRVKRLIPIVGAGGGKAVDWRVETE